MSDAWRTTLLLFAALCCATALFVLLRSHLTAREREHSTNAAEGYPTELARARAWANGHGFEGSVVDCGITMPDATGWSIDGCIIRMPGQTTPVQLDCQHAPCVELVRVP